MGAFKIVKLVGQGLNNTIISGGLVPKGAYDNATDYAVGDSVSYNGSSYVMHTDAVAGTLPTDTTKWQVLANKGSTGATGATGATGSSGSDGVGVPTGGTTGQILAKNSNTNYDTHWITSSGTGDMVAATYDPAGISEQLVGLTATQTLSGKTFTQTGLKIKGGDANTVTIKPNETETAARILNLKINDADRTIDLSGNLTVSSAATISGTNTGDQTNITGNAATATKATNIAGGNNTTQLGDIPYQSDTDTTTLLTPNTTTTKKFLTQTGDGTNGAAPAWGTIAAGDVPTLNQNTTGSAATLTTPRAIYGNNFDGSAALTQVIASTYGGTGNGFTKFTGPTTAEKTFTLPDSSSTIVVQGGELGTPSSGTLTNATGLPVAGITSSTSTPLGVGSLEVGHATDTTITRTGAGDIAVEGNGIYRAGGTDVAVADGGSGASTLTGILKGNGTSAFTAVTAPSGTIVGTSDSQVLTAKQYQFAEAPSNQVAEGLTVSMTYGESIVPGDLLYFKSDGKVYKADSDGTSTYPVMGLALATASSGSNLVLLNGIYRDDSRYNFTVGGLVYLSTTAGSETQTQPSATDNVIQVVGVATHADRIYFNPVLTYITHT